MKNFEFEVIIGEDEEVDDSLRRGISYFETIRSGIASKKEQDRLWAMKPVLDIM